MLDVNQLREKGCLRPGCSSTCQWTDGNEVLAAEVKGPQVRVAEFERDPRRRAMVMSLRAGGVGFNLTSASHVFHFDRPAGVTIRQDRTANLAFNNRIAAIA
jgi:hypothetical protein